MAENGPAGVGDLAVKLFDIIKQEPLIALVAIAFAVLIVFATMFMNKSGSIGKVLISSFMGLCLAILGLGTFILFFPPSDNSLVAAQPIKAALQVRLNTKGQPLVGRLKGISKVTIDKGELFQLRKQNEARPGSWKDKMRLVGDRPDTLFVTISNRRFIECRVDEIATGADAPLDDEFESPSTAVGPGRPQYSNTTFEIDLSDAYTNDRPVVLEMEYRDHQPFDEIGGRLKGDMLTFKQWDGLDYEKIGVIPQHDETLVCLEQEPISHKFDREEITRRGDADGGWSFVTRAWAQSKLENQKQFIRTFTRRGSQSDKTRINDYFNSQKKEIAPVSTSILGDETIPDLEKRNYLETLLQLPVAERPKTPAFLKVLVPFVTHPNFQIRRNAARILRAPDYINEDVVTAFEEYFEKEKDALAQISVPGRDYSAQYLAVAAGRDIFYNKGIKETNALRKNFTRLSKEERAERLNNAIRSFQAGKKYAEYAPPAREVLFSKLDYGISYAYFRQVMAEYAAEKSKAKSNSELKTAILGELEAGTIVPPDEPLVSMARKSFKKFIASLGDNAARYSWQHHITQAENCLKSSDGLAFDCMEPPKSG